MKSLSEDELSTFKSEIHNPSVLYTSYEVNCEQYSACFFHVSNNPAARWIQVYNLHLRRNVTIYGGGRNIDQMEFFIRGPGTCFDCAINSIALKDRLEESPRNARTAAIVLL